MSPKTQGMSSGLMGKALSCAGVKGMLSWLSSWAGEPAYKCQVSPMHVRDLTQVPMCFPMMDTLSMRSGTCSIPQCPGVKQSI